MVSFVKSRSEAERGVANAPDQVVDVDRGELDSYSRLGWRFVSVVTEESNGKGRKGVAPHPAP